MSTIDLSRPRRIHVIGAGGAGMSSIALVLAEQGHDVSGSDLRDGPVLDRLRSLGVRVSIGHDAANLADDVEVVTRSTAVPDANPEVAAATGRGLPVLRRAEVLTALCALRPAVAVAGTHGKTTTSSMLALALLTAGAEPSFIIGGELNEIGGGAAWSAHGDGPFVVEADESDGTFVELGARNVVVTSLEPDHLGHWGGFDELVDAFGRFVAGSDLAVICADDPGAAALAEGVASATTYGTAAQAGVRIVDRRTDGVGQRFGLVGQVGATVVGTADEPCEVRLAVPGLHNARNATAALVAAVGLGTSTEAAAQGLARYTGVARRFEFRGRAAGVTFVDDYAHLPTEVAATVSAAHEAGFDRIVAVFQPHRFSRTADLHADFAGAFAGVDHLVVTDIYPSGEPPRPGVSGRLVADAVAAGVDAPGALTYEPDPLALADTVAALLDEGVLCLTMGAGDLTALPSVLVERLGS